MNGGEGGIRTLTAPLESVSYRNHLATAARSAVDAVGHCPPLPADPLLLAATARGCSRPSLRSVQDADDVDDVLTHGVDHDPGQGRKTSSRVPAFLPGRPRCGYDRSPSGAS